jgi:hypothetical protein
MRQIREADLLPTKVGLLPQNLLIPCHFALQRSGELGYTGLVGLAAMPGEDDPLEDDAGCVGVEVEGLNGSSGFEEGSFLEVGGGGQKGRVGLGGDVASDGARFEEDKSLIILKSRMGMSEDGT